jgi:hypothetical protein|tara:strand:+ start:5918 stop:6355 length:438 start_codon:yes stop_codon:yes gene_type:complete
MIEEIIKEKTSADHLLYVSLKYTKTGDVILNLLSRWKSLMELSFDFLIADKIEKGKIPREPASPKERIEFMKKYFKKQIAIQDAIPLYVFFKRVPGLPKSRVGEFRKNVALNVKMPNEIVIINMEKLAEYSEVLDRFVNVIKTFA